MSERILIVSDTHGRLNYFKEMLARTGKPDRLIHLGDSEGQQDEIARLAGCPVDIVRGNCDYSSDLAQDKLIEIGKYRVFLTHGHRYQVNFGIQTLKEHFFVEQTSQCMVTLTCRLSIREGMSLS